VNIRSTSFMDWLIEQLCGRRLPPAENARARTWLLQAAAALGLVDATSTDPFPTDSIRYQGIELVAAIEGAARELLGEDYQPGRWRASPSGTQLALPSLHNASTVPYRDPNSATRQQLAELPGFGPVSSAKVVNGRVRRPFTDLDEVRRASGIARAAWETASLRLSLDPTVTARSAPQPLPLTRLADQARQGRGPIVGMAGSTPSQALRAAVIASCQKVLRRPLVPVLFGPSQQRLTANAFAMARYSAGPRMPVAGVALITDGTYLQLTQELLDAAQKSIRVAMFFLDGDSAPVQDLIRRLAAARTRGVTVRLMIGDDLPGDRHDAAGTNAAARTRLEAAGLPTRLHWPEMALHEKSVLIDDRWTMTGSHNWTPRSFFGAGETSVCADSAELTSVLQDRFDARWDALDPATAQRRVAASVLEQLTTTQVASLQTAGQSRPSHLPSSAGLTRLATDTKIPAATLRLAKRTADLMEALRVCETTAVLLSAAGLNTPTAVQSASKRTLTSALSGALTTPPRLAGRRVAPQIADVLAKDE
jgi:PLD-like domain